MRRFFCYALIGLCLCSSLQGCSTRTGAAAAVTALGVTAISQGGVTGNPWLLGTGIAGTLLGAGMLGDAMYSDYGVRVGPDPRYYNYTERAIYNELDRPIYLNDPQPRRF